MISSASHQPALSDRPAASPPGRLIGRLPAYLLLAALIILAGCSADDPAKERKSGSAGKAAVAVTTALSTTKDVPIAIEATGRIEASATVGIKSQINGSLETIHFTEGQEVRKGDLLFTIDRRPYLAAVKAKEALLAKDRAELANAEKSCSATCPPPEAATSPRSWPIRPPPRSPAWPPPSGPMRRQLTRPASTCSSVP